MKPLASVPARKRAADHLGRDAVLVLEVALHQLVVVLGDRIDENVVLGLRRLEQRIGDLADGERLPEIVVVRDRLHLDEVDDAGMMLLLADGICTQTGWAPRRSRIDCTAAKKSAPVRSILLMNAMRGTP